MNERCLIGMLNGDGTVSYIECTHDGGLEGAGRILEAHYLDSDKLRRLMLAGDVRALGVSPAMSRDQVRGSVDAVGDLLRCEPIQRTHVSRQHEPP